MLQKKNNLAEIFKVNGMGDGQVKPFSLEVMAKERRNECLHYDDGVEKWKRWDEFVVHPEFLKIAKSLHVRRREDLKTKDYTILSPCNWKTVSFKKKKKENQERSKLAKGNSICVINNTIYLLCMNYRSLNVSSFCNFYSLEKRNCLK